MAYDAGSFGKGFVRVGALLGCFCFWMTGEAQLRFFGDKQLFVLGGMSAVARQAAPVFGHGLVDNLGWGIFFRVAVEAEVVAFFCQQGCVFGGVRVVAGKALPFLKGCVFDRAAGF